jgi:ComF family protein
MNLFDMLFPRRCVLCGKKSEREICRECDESLPRVTRQGGGCLAPLYYRGTVRQAMQRFKFREDLACAAFFGKLMADCVRENLRDFSSMTVTWVPSSRRRRWKRGYDQCRELAKIVARELGLPLVSAMRKTRHNPAQSSLNSPGDRRKNVEGAFECHTGLEGKNMLLVDDIRTTGATLEQCRKILVLAGAKNVIMLIGAKK